MKKVKQILLVIVLCGFVATYAQQEPHYTQYMYNMSVVNPGYMINEPGLIKVGSLYRTQWVGIEGAPKTANVFANIPLSDKIELSLNYLNDNIGSKANLTQNVFNLDAAYKLKLNNDLGLALGMKLGVDNFSSNLSGLTSLDPSSSNKKKTFLNIGAGMFLFKKNFYAGLSSPNLLPATVKVNDDVLYANNLHVFLIGGYVFELNDNLKLKPSFVAKYVSGAPLSFDLSVNTLFYKRFETGVSYRYQDAIAALLGFYVTADLRLGYSYDFNTSDLNEYNSGSHEFMISYTFDILGLSKKYESPRFY